MAKLTSYNFKFIYALNGKIITKEEAIQHVVDVQKKNKEKEAEQKRSD